MFVIKLIHKKTFDAKVFYIPHIPKAALNYKYIGRCVEAQQAFTTCPL